MAQAEIRSELSDKGRGLGITSMMQMPIIGVLWLSLVVRGFAAAFSEDPRTVPVLIAHGAGTGSGCILLLSNSVYFITAKHVLFLDSEGTNPPALRSKVAVLKTFSRVGTTNISQRVIEVQLAELLSAGEIRHSSNRDIAIIRIEECNPDDRRIVHLLPGVKFLTPNMGFSPVSASNVCVAKDIDVGEDVLMFGYPTSITGPISAIFDPSEPLLRKGIVAGINLERKTVIIDCPSYFGNSGGPVIQVDHPFIDVTRFRLIGLVSGFVPFQEWENKTMKYSHVVKSNSGYTVVEPMDTVLDLVWK